MDNAEKIARAFHEAYERLALKHDYETRMSSRRPWPDVPENNRMLMIDVAKELLDRDIIRAGDG
jgi:hypothetical protein